MTNPELVVPVRLTPGHISEGLPEFFTKWAEETGKNLLIDNYFVFDASGRNIEVIADELEDVSKQASHAPLAIPESDLRECPSDLSEALNSRGVKFYGVKN